MGQAKLQIPHHRFKKVFADGLQVANQLNRFFRSWKATFNDCYTWKRISSYTTINCLLRTLRRRDHIPDTIYLHLDNTPRENKT